jgi:autotransporter-associated beta strand protein
LRNDFRARLDLTALDALILPSATWTQVAAPPAPVDVMMELTDGRIFAHAAAITNQWYILTADAQGNFTDGTWTTAAPMNVARSDFVSNVLTDGDVLVLGGEKTNDIPGSQGFTFTSSGEIYDPALNSWTPTDVFPGQTNGPWGGGPAPTELLASGKVLTGAFWSTQTWLFDPTKPAGQQPSQQWIGTGNKLNEAGNLPANDGNGDHSGEEGAVQLLDGSVLTYDLRRSDPSVFSGAGFKAGRYFPSTGQWGDASYLDPSNPPPVLGAYANNGSPGEIGPPMLLPPTPAHPDGEVLWIGANNHAAIYDPTGTTQITSGSTTVTEYGTWSAVQQDLPFDNGDELPVAELANGNVLLSLLSSDANGPYALQYQSSTQSFVPLYTSNSGPATGALAREGDLLDLPNGHVLMSDDQGQLWDLDPGISPTDITSETWRPQIQGITHNANDPAGTFTVTGTGLTGVSEGSTEGDDAEMSTNYPIVKLTLGSNVWYAKTHGWTPGVQEGLTSVKFDLPANIPANAPYTVTVVASGVPSDPAPFNNTHVIYADSSWQGPSYPNGTGIPDADPVLAGLQPRTIGTDAFATIASAISAAGPGGWVAVNGANGVSGSGVFTEQVSLDGTVGVYMQNGSVTVTSLKSTAPGNAGFLILGGATLITGDANNTEYDGTILGAGGLTKTGTGVFTLTGVNTYSGVSSSTATTINQGTLAVAGDAQLGALSGGVTFNGGTLQAVVGFTSARTVAFDGGGTIDTNGFDVTLSGAFLQRSGGLTKVGTGSLTLAGTDNATGPTTVAGGTLIVASTGAIVNGGVTVNAGATLRGSGIIQGSVLVAGTLEGGTPTNTGGLLEIGNLSFASTGAFSTRLNSSTAFDKVVVLGNVALNGASLIVLPGYSAAPGTQFQLVGGNVTGAFANLPGTAVVTAGGQHFVISYQTGVSLSVPGDPYVAGVQVNDGSAQRSEVESFTVTFSTAVTFSGGNAAGAFQLKHLTDNTNVFLSAAISTDVQGRTQVVLTFSGSEIDPNSLMGNYTNASLADGLYQLTIFGSAIVGSNGVALDGAGKNIAGSNFVSPTDTNQGSGLRLFRLFGDVTGDGVVDQVDLGQFRLAFNTTTLEEFYRWYLDSDNSGSIDQLDLGQFRTRFSTNVF